MLRQQRDYALFCAYQKALEENDFSNQWEAVEYVRTHAAPKWFVSKEFCAAVISCRLRGTDHYKMGKSKKRKFDALFDLYQQKKREHPYCCHLALCEEIVEMPAPEWYIEHQIAGRIIKEQMQRRNELMAKKW